MSRTTKNNIEKDVNQPQEDAYVSFKRGSTDDTPKRINVPVTPSWNMASPSNYLFSSGGNHRPTSIKRQHRSQMNKDLPTGVCQPSIGGASQTLEAKSPITRTNPAIVRKNTQTMRMKPPKFQRPPIQQQAKTFRNLELGHAKQSPIDMYQSRLQLVPGQVGVTRQGNLKLDAMSQSTHRQTDFNKSESAAGGTETMHFFSQRTFAMMSPSNKMGATPSNAMTNQPSDASFAETTTDNQRYHEMVQVYNNDASQKQRQPDALIMMPQVTQIQIPNLGHLSDSTSNFTALQGSELHPSTERARFENRLFSQQITILDAKENFAEMKSVSDLLDNTQKQMSPKIALFRDSVETTQLGIAGGAANHDQFRPISAEKTDGMATQVFKIHPVHARVNSQRAPPENKAVRQELMQHLNKVVSQPIAPNSQYSSYLPKEEMKHVKNKIMSSLQTRKDQNGSLKLLSTKDQLMKMHDGSMSRVLSPTSNSRHFTNLFESGPSQQSRALVVQSNLPKKRAQTLAMSAIVLPMPRTQHVATGQVTPVITMRPNMSLSKQVESNENSFIFSGRIKGEEEKTSIHRAVWQLEDKSMTTGQPDLLSAQGGGRCMNLDSSFKSLAKSASTDKLFIQRQLELQKEVEKQYQAVTIGTRKTSHVVLSNSANQHRILRPTIAAAAMPERAFATMDVPFTTAQPGVDQLVLQQHQQNQPLCPPPNESRQVKMLHQQFKSHQMPEQQQRSSREVLFGQTQSQNPISIVKLMKNWKNKNVKPLDKAATAPDKAAEECWTIRNGTRYSTNLGATAAAALAEKAPHSDSESDKNHLEVADHNDLEGRESQVESVKCDDFGDDHFNSPVVQNHHLFIRNKSQQEMMDFSLQQPDDFMAATPELEDTTHTLPSVMGTNAKASIVSAGHLDSIFKENYHPKMGTSQQLFKTTHHANELGSIIGIVIEAQESKLSETKYDRKTYESVGDDTFSPMIPLEEDTEQTVPRFKGSILDRSASHLAFSTKNVKHVNKATPVVKDGIIRRYPSTNVKQKQQFAKGIKSDFKTTAHPSEHSMTALKLKIPGKATNMKLNYKSMTQRDGGFFQQHSSNAQSQLLQTAIKQKEPLNNMMRQDFLQSLKEVTQERAVEISRKNKRQMQKITKFRKLLVKPASQQLSGSKTVTNRAQQHKMQFSGQMKAISTAGRLSRLTIDPFHSTNFKYKESPDMRLKDTAKLSIEAELQSAIKIRQFSKHNLDNPPTNEKPSTTTSKKQQPVLARRLIKQKAKAKEFVEGKIDPSSDEGLNTDESILQESEYKLPQSNADLYTMKHTEHIRRTLEQEVMRMPRVPSVTLLNQEVVQLQQSQGRQCNNVVLVDSPTARQQGAKLFLAKEQTMINRFNQSDRLFQKHRIEVQASKEKKLQQLKSNYVIDFEKMKKHEKEEAFKQKLTNIRKLIVEQHHLIRDGFPTDFEQLLLTKVNLFPQSSYENSDTREFLRQVKLDQLDTVAKMVHHDPYLVFQYDEINQTALMWAVKRQFSYMVRFLLKAFSRVNQKDLTGRTALNFAVELGNAELVKILICFKADAKQKNNQGMSIMEIYEQNRRKDKKTNLQIGQYMSTGAEQLERQVTINFTWNYILSMRTLKSQKTKKMESREQKEKRLEAEKGKDLMKGWTKKERQAREWQNEVLARLDPQRELEEDELDLFNKRQLRKQQERENTVNVSNDEKKMKEEAKKLRLEQGMEQRIKLAESALRTIP